ncbi:MAG: hypothetical protein JXB38_09555 [Anaerolineales bacterium]|nr:hypothetical protein [Anaerolineales bacterium]
MEPSKHFLKQPKSFWANVRSISEQTGYTDTVTGQVKFLSLDDILSALSSRNLSLSHVVDEKGTITSFGKTLVDYYQYRADVLNEYVESRLMDVEKAQKTFYELRDSLSPSCPLPMNKQSGEKRAPAYFTGIINMLIEANIGDYSCDYNPRMLTTITRDQTPLRTLARWVDGAFPGTINPIAIWEIKEYYYTTTFGSRIADGVYETLMDGMELEELYEHEQIEVKHYFMVDAHYTWWGMGKSYLCRMIDMLHMGYVDEVLFGYEVVERLPILVKEWIASLDIRDAAH